MVSEEIKVKSQGTQEVIEADFKEKTVRKITVTEDTAPAKFLRDCAKYAKENKIKSVMVLMIDESDHVDWIMELTSEYHAALLALTLEDAREDVKAQLFQEEEVEL
jgi:translation elongation factor EF-G